MFHLPLTLPNELKRPYQMARVVLYVIVIASTLSFVLQTLFPTLVFSFNFRTPSSSKNNLLDPHAPDNTPNMNGRIGTDEALISTASVAGQFSQARIDLVPERKSAPLGTIEVSLRRSYRSFFLPVGTPLVAFPLESLYRVDNTYCVLRDNILIPFVSDSAYLSRYRDTDALSRDADFLSNHTLSENWIGYRIGSTVSFADGVFLIVSETEMRPFGSAEIFLALGYRFEDVIPASEEEIGIYKRGRIITLGTQHPDGTLFLDQDTQTFYLTEGTFKRPLQSEEYLAFIKSRQSPIVASSQGSKQEARCVLEPGLLGQSFSCQAPINILQTGFGNDFEITLKKSDADIDVNTLQVSFETETSRQNMLLILSKVKQRLLSRFGIGQ